MQFAEYRKHDALSLASLVKSREVTSRELLDAAIERLEAVNPALNAVVHRCYDRARDRLADISLDAPFAGVPFLVKDLDGVLAGEPFTGSSRSLVGYVPQTSSELFLRYERAGLGIFAKTNTPEFGILAVTESELRGPCRNPWNPDHTPGGSSGGSASAVAAGIVPVAHAGDGGGSIRIPASCCGLFGLKPTRGRMPLGPDAGEGWNGFVVPHVVSRSVRDSAALLDATHGQDIGAPYVATAPNRPFLDEVSASPGRLRIGLVGGSLFGRTIGADCAAAVDHAGKLCASLGHVVEEITLPFHRDALVRSYLVVISACVAYQVENASRIMGRPARPEDFEPATWFLSQVGRALSAFELEDARMTFQLATRKIAAATARYDLLLTSTLAHPPAKVGELSTKPWEKAGLALMRAMPARSLLEKALETMSQSALEKTPNTMLFNMTGQPAMSVPLAWNGAGLPIGVQFVGKLGDEATLFRLAGQLESAQPWFGRVAG